MDPNALISAVRADLAELGTSKDKADAIDIIDESIESLRNLRHWLVKGGFLPMPHADADDGYLPE